MFLMYTNSKAKLEGIRETPRKAVKQTNGLDGYVIGLTGDSFTEEKLFAMKQMSNQGPGLKISGSVFTSGVLNTGLDNSDLQYLLMVDIPESVRHAFQEIGRIGRRQEATHLTNMVDIVINVSSYLFLHHCLNYFLKKSNLSREEKRTNSE